MAKRQAEQCAGSPFRSLGASEGDGSDPATKRTKRTYTQAEVDEIVQEQVKAALAQAELKPVPPLLQETFTPNDPVHGLMHLPGLVKVMVDTANFQRMRQIKQLGICHYVYPGATHTRFFHSIGTAFLAYELIKGLRQRQPELGVTDRDVLCATLAALCHDLGHPCYSHMFEVFLHDMGRERRQRPEALSKEEEVRLRQYESWTHEQASVMLLQEMFEELRGTLQLAGLRSDALGDDFACIAELIDPPKRRLEELQESGRLREGWSGIIKGRPVGKAWLYEIVSNWRSGIDVDKFDYFRRDTLFLGIQRQFDHGRYLKGVKVIQDQDGENGVLTISPPEKDKYSLRDNMMELRKMLHRTAYQHKTVKKIELHMIDVLKIMDQHVRVTGQGGVKMRMSEAAIALDPVAYPKLTDTFVEARLTDHEDPALEAAATEFDRRIVRRQLMRLVADWDLPRPGDEDMPSTAGPFQLPVTDDVIAGLLQEYGSCATDISPEAAVREVGQGEFRCQVATFHYGMGSRDPISRVLFHSSKTAVRRGVQHDGDARPLRQKIFVFWNPGGQPDDELTLTRLTLAFRRWADGLFTRHVASAGGAAPAQGGQQAPIANKPQAPQGGRPRRALKIQASCPLTM